MCGGRRSCLDCDRASVCFRDRKDGDGAEAILERYAFGLAEARKRLVAGAETWCSTEGLDGPGLRWKREAGLELCGLRRCSEDVEKTQKCERREKGASVV